MLSSSSVLSAADSFRDLAINLALDCLRPDSRATRSLRGLRSALGISSRIKPDVSELELESALNPPSLTCVLFVGDPL